MFDFSQLQAIDLPLETILLFIFYLVLGIYAVFSAILYYHWRAYATDAKVTAYTLMTYFGTTVPLFIIMGILVFII